MNSQEKYYSITDLPIFNWNKIHEEGATDENLVKYLGNHENPTEIWASINNEYIKEFGIPQKQKERVMILKRVAQLQDEFVRTKNYTLRTHIRRELNLLKDEKPGMPFYELKATMDRAFKMVINPKTTPVIEFFYHLKSLKDG